MKKLISYFLISLFISSSVVAKTLEQKKDELKKIYEVGGISKVEYEKAKEFLDNSKKNNKEKKTKQTLNLTKKKTSKKKSIFKKDKKPILEEDLAKIEIYNKKKFQEEFLKYPPEVIKFFGKGSNIITRGKKAGKFMSIEFNRSEQGQQRFPGKMIKAMAAFEIFYIDSLRKNQKAVERYKENKGKKYTRKSSDESKIRSLISMNQGREKMRKALGMNLDTPRTEAIKKFWYLGDFLNLGKALNNSEYDKNLDERKKLLVLYKQKITQLKDKIKEEQKSEDIN